MRYLLLCSVVCFFLVLQGGLILLSVPAWLMPQCAIVSVVFLSFYECSVVAACVAFLLGLLVDLASGVAVGPWAGSYVFVFGLLTICSQRLFLESLAVRVVVGGVTSIVAGLFFSLLAVKSAALTLSQLVIQGGLTALCAPFIFLILHRIWQGGAIEGSRGRWSLSSM